MDLVMGSNGLIVSFFEMDSLKDSLGPLSELSWKHATKEGRRI